VRIKSKLNNPHRYWAKVKLENLSPFIKLRHCIGLKNTVIGVFLEKKNNNLRFIFNFFMKVVITIPTGIKICGKFIQTCCR